MGSQGYLILVSSCPSSFCLCLCHVLIDVLHLQLLSLAFVHGSSIPQEYCSSGYSFVLVTNVSLGVFSPVFQRFRAGHHPEVHQGVCWSQRCVGAAPLPQQPGVERAGRLRPPRSVLTHLSILLFLCSSSMCSAFVFFRVFLLPYSLCHKPFVHRSASLEARQHHVVCVWSFVSISHYSHVLSHIVSSVSVCAYRFPLCCA